jgi:hypothetical protein
LKLNGDESRVAKRKRRVTGRHPAFSGGEKKSFHERDVNIGKKAMAL